MRIQMVGVQIEEQKRVTGSSSPIVKIKTIFLKKNYPNVSAAMSQPDPRPDPNLSEMSP